VISVGIVDRDELSLLGLRYLLESQTDFVVAFASNGLEDLQDVPFDCLVLDLELLGKLTEWGRAHGGAAPLRVIGLAADRPLADQYRRMRPDLAEIHLRDDAARELVRAVRRVTAYASAPAGAVVRTGIACLSPRELEVLRHIAVGFTHYQVARRVGISRHTVDTYVKRIKAKLGVSSKVQLVRAAITAGAGA
jgi:DNA-binding NarL/FixJ family response regulator